MSTLNMYHIIIALSEYQKLLETMNNEYGGKSQGHTYAVKNLQVVHNAFNDITTYNKEIADNYRYIGR